MNISIRKLATLMLFVLTLSSFTVVAQDENRLSTSVTIDAASKYIWRGFNVVDDAVLQPGVSVSAYGFTVGYWGNMDLTDINGEEHEFTEHDYYASYGYDMGSAGAIEVGTIFYYFPSLNDSNGNDDPDTVDVYGGYSVSLGNVVDFGVTGYYEVDEWDAWYVNFSLSKDFELKSGWSLGTSLSVGYAGENYNKDAWGVADAEADWNDLNLGVSVSGPISDRVSASFGFNYTELLSGKIADSVEDGGGTPDNFWFVFGIEISL